jgi:hypothetical protein
MEQETENAGMSEFVQTFASYDTLTLIGKGRDESGQVVQRYIVYTLFGSDFYITTRIPREGLAAYQKTLDEMVKVAAKIKVSFQKVQCFDPKLSFDLAGQVVMIGKDPVAYVASCHPLEIKDACAGLRRASAL